MIRSKITVEANAEDDLSARPSHHDNEEEHDHDDFESIVYDLDIVNQTDEILENIKKLTNEHEVLRIKGYLAVKDKPLRFLIQAVGTRVRGQYDRMWKNNEVKKSKLVFIAEHNKINKKIIEKYLLG
jgi:cobalamin biosynthesis protein CobW